VAEERPLTDDDPRIRFAGERTLLAWLRTGLAMMAFGFVVARFGVFLHEVAPVRPNAPPPTSGPSFWFGTALLILGAAVNLLAATDHANFLRRLNRREPYRVPRWSLGLILSMVLAVGGLILTAYLVVVYG
jgi:putative membrane protein